MNEQIKNLVMNIETVIYGKRDVVFKLVAAMLCGGHVLIEDVPGVGKTRLVSALARSVRGKFNRIQLTPDVMPSDIVGFTMLDPETKKFVFHQGAAVCNFLLADEINRASPKVQSSLLEVMEEGQISVDSKTYTLAKPFMTLATQNPVETLGTFQLPEAQMDRFLIRLSMGYPSPADEMRLLEGGGEAEHRKVQPVMTTEHVVELSQQVDQIFVDKAVREYIIRLVLATRNNENIRLGVSPRGSMGLNSMAKAIAFMQGRQFVTPDDVIEAAPDVLAHRIVLSQKGKSYYRTQQAAVEDILRAVPLPAAAPARSR